MHDIHWRVLPFKARSPGKGTCRSHRRVSAIDRSPKDGVFPRRTGASLDRGNGSCMPRFDETIMEAEGAVRFPARSRYILLAGAFVVGWSASRAIGAHSEAPR